MAKRKSDADETVKESKKLPIKTRDSKKLAANKRSVKPKKLTDSSDASTGTSVTLVCSAPNQDRLYLRIERLVTSEEIDAEYRAREKELDAEFDRARTAMKDLAAEILQTDRFPENHITGLSVRFRSKFGQTVSPLQVVIAVNVATKYSLEHLEQLGMECIKCSYHNVPVKVLEGAFENLSPTQPQPGVLLSGSTTKPVNPLSFSQPITGGVPVARTGALTKFGTLGVVHSGNGTKGFGLTCRHVAGAQNTVIEQLGPDVAGVVTSRKVGTVQVAPAIGPFGPNTSDETVDCAIVDLVSPPPPAAPISYIGKGSWVRELVEASGVLYYSSTRVSLSHRAFPIFKFGAATGVMRIGTLDAVNDQIIIINGNQYVNNFSVKAKEPSNHFVTDGDSGSILVMQTPLVPGGNPELVAIGILFARLSGQSQIGVACNMCEVLKALRNPIPGNRLKPIF